MGRYRYSSAQSEGDVQTHGGHLHLELPVRFLAACLPIMREHDLSDAEETADSVKRYKSDEFTLRITDYSVAQLQALALVLKGVKGVISHLNGYINLRTGAKAKVPSLQLLPNALGRLLVSNVIDGWVYRKGPDGTLLAFVVDKIYYTPPDRQTNAHVTMVLKAARARFSARDEDGERNSRSDELTETVVWEYGDMVGRSPAQCLLEQGLLLETEDLRDAYLRMQLRFAKLRPLKYAQFLCVGRALEANSSSYYYRDDDWYVLPHATKMVNEESLLTRNFDGRIGNSFFAAFRIDSSSQAFQRVPMHFYMLMFDLTRHEHVWVHVDNCKPYVYDDSLAAKLILPEHHKMLVDVLCDDMDVFSETDIVEGKSGGTAILCYGRPGLGKTLTAEVYSERVRKPLYRVHAGQLGTDIATVENALEKILRRAERWSCVMLIDEADVYIRRRDNDIKHNAVVAAFLRVLEYFHGLLFMTTNRADDVDDAIASRMVAMFKYEEPDAEQSKRIWRVMADAFGIKLTEKFIAELVATYPNTAGRDIKMLLKLTVKYCRQKKVPLNSAAFATCAMFRGIK